MLTIAPIYSVLNSVKLGYKLLKYDSLDLTSGFSVRVSGEASNDELSVSFLKLKASL